jgi:hypothetical protein
MRIIYPREEIIRIGDDELFVGVLRNLYSRAEVASRVGCNRDAERLRHTANDLRNYYSNILGRTVGHEEVMGRIGAIVLATVGN